MSIGSGWCCKVILASGVIGGPWIKKSMLFFLFHFLEAGSFSLSEGPGGGLCICPWFP